MTRPTLAECLGVSTRWQALAVLASEMHAAGLISAAGDCLDASVSVHCRDASDLRRDASFMCSCARAWNQAAGDARNHARAYAFIAWELIAELRERRARERWEADVAPRNCCGRCDRCGRTPWRGTYGRIYCDCTLKGPLPPRTSCAGCGRKLEEVR